MNYVELHIGDYEKATAHLTACEDGIYGRLIRRYYDTEKPLPADVKAVQRLVRARSKDERQAVETVLEEFFHLGVDGWRHGRCDEEIARYQAKREKAQASANARWSKQQSVSERNANASETDMRTHCDGNAHQSPVTSHQSTHEGLTHAEVPRGTEAGRACLLMRQAGCVQTNPGHPDLIAAIAEGVSPETLAATAAEAIEARKPKPFGWAVATARGRHAEGPKPIPAGAPHATRSQPRLSLADQVRDPGERDAIPSTAIRLAHR